MVIASNPDQNADIYRIDSSFQLKSYGSFIQSKYNCAINGSLSRDQELYTAGFRTGIVNVWSVETRDIIHSFESKPHQSELTYIKFVDGMFNQNEYNNYVCSCDSKNIFKLWDLRLNYPVMTINKLFKGSCSAIEPLNDYRIAMGSINGDLKLMDFRNILFEENDKNLQKLYDTKLTGEIYNIKKEKDKIWICNDTNLKVLDLQTGVMENKFDNFHNKMIMKCINTPLPDRMLTLSTDKMLHVVNPSSLQKLHTFTLDIECHNAVYQNNDLLVFDGSNIKVFNCSSVLENYGEQVKNETVYKNRKVLKLYSKNKLNHNKFEQTLKEFKHIESLDNVITNSSDSAQILSVVLELVKRCEFESVLSKYNNKFLLLNLINEKLAEGEYFSEWLDVLDVLLNYIDLDDISEVYSLDTLKKIKDAIDTNANDDQFQHYNQVQGILELF